jgi:hypothetical protein
MSLSKVATKNELKKVTEANNKLTALALSYNLELLKVIGDDSSSIKIDSSIANLYQVWDIEYTYFNEWVEKRVNIIISEMQNQVYYVSFTWVDLTLDADYSGSVKRQLKLRFDHR